MVARVKTTKSGLLRKRTRTRLMRQAWQVKQFRLAGFMLLYKAPSDTKEVNFQLDEQTTAERYECESGDGGPPMKHVFRIVNSTGEELLLASMDRKDMDGWLAALDKVVGEQRLRSERIKEEGEKFGRVGVGGESVSSDEGGSFADASESESG